MQKKKNAFVPFAAGALSIYLCFSSTTVFAATPLLKKGMQGSQVAKLQRDLKNLGFFSMEPTGYYGEITTAAVKKFQARYGLIQDGIAGNMTQQLIGKLLDNSGTGVSGSTALKAASAKTSVSRGESTDTNYLVPWFGGAEKIFSIGKTATVYDIDSGLSFKVKRTYGHNHADCEALTQMDAAIMKKIYGGQWSWVRRAVIVTVDGRKMAASMAGMPHAGLDSAPNAAYVNSRSGGYGAGINLDNVKGNGMNGHFDIHFLNSKTHGSNKVDSAHQKMVQKAAEWAKKNY